MSWIDKWISDAQRIGFSRREIRSVEYFVGFQRLETEAPRKGLIIYIGGDQVMLSTHEIERYQ